MNKDQLLQKYRTRLVKEGMISSALYGLMIGACADFLTAFVCWLLSYHHVWLAICVGLVAMLISSVILYFAKFRPTKRRVAHRIDRMGLEERTVTMLDLEADDSCMARLQREDAVRRMSEVSDRQRRDAFPFFSLKGGSIAAICISLVCGIGMTVVVALTASGVITPPNIIDINTPKENFVNVSYLVEGGGDIEGEPEQPVLRGEDATPVVAVADEGWMFIGWSDGVQDTERTDCRVTADLVVTALFEEVENTVGDEEGDENNVPSEGDGADDLPDGPGSGAGSEGDGGEGNGDGSSGEGAGEGDGGQEGEGKGDGRGDGAGGGWADSNQVIDGKTEYRDVLELYRDMAMEILNAGGEIPPELRKLIEEYFGSI